jgi:MoaA/NifB/PqqE/SkfB family radical SAM enzyme
MIKKVNSKDYNYVFNDKSGYFVRWGKTLDKDAVFSPFGPEIADIEISTICHGVNGIPCQHCYKSNTGIGRNMTLDTFKTIFHKLPDNLTQIAFGIGDIGGNPDMIKIFEYCREHGIVPNVTINGQDLTVNWATRLAELCGAVAVSRYNSKDTCYNAVKKLSDAGLKQVNIHQLVSKETFVNCINTVGDIKNDPRLSKLNAIVFLSLKQKGRGVGYSKLESSMFDRLMHDCMRLKVPFGMDSCSAHKFISFMDRNPSSFKNRDELLEMIEPCESTLFSIYINVDGELTPCSFCEGKVKSISLLDSDITKENFIKKAWGDETIKSFRGALLANDRRCPVYDV